MEVMNELLYFQFCVLKMTDLECFAKRMKKTQERKKVFAYYFSHKKFIFPNFRPKTRKYVGRA